MSGAVPSSLLLVAILMAGAQAAAQAIRFATYNVSGGARDVPAIATAVARLAPDVIGIQELSPTGAERLDEALASRFAFRFFPKPSQGGGLAIASRLPLRRPRYRPSLHGGNGFVLAELELGGRLLQLVNLHLDPIKIWTVGQKLILPWQLLRHGAVHRRELAQALDELPVGSAAVVLGDLNSYAGDAAPDWLLARGFVDSFAVAGNAPNATTHRFTVAGHRWADRIDFIFHTPDLRTVESQIIAGGPSDHDPVVSALEWASP